MAVSTLCRYGVVGVYLLLPGAGKKWTAVQRLQYSVHVESQSQSEYKYIVAPVLLTPTVVRCGFCSVLLASQSNSDQGVAHACAAKRRRATKMRYSGVLSSLHCVVDAKRLFLTFLILLFCSPTGQKL
jgi:hypothetical protein